MKRGRERTRTLKGQRDQNPPLPEVVAKTALEVRDQQNFTFCLATQTMVPRASGRMSMKGRLTKRKKKDRQGLFSHKKK